MAKKRPGFRYVSQVKLGGTRVPSLVADVNGFMANSVRQANGTKRRKSTGKRRR